MGAYQYRYGDRPLEGYTIQQAAGRGGFGEVYYAISDSGRQVALKAVQSYEQIELRGISQCMNLKSPHLVTVFDVKYNDDGRPFVIMEYVSGPSLSDLLRESPGGLGTQKAAFFLREIAKGLSFLHDCGIVHRDLKPSNIFYENGYVKIGDYGLTKAIGTDPNISHTTTVGTVHYMAPEIREGRYDRSIDIYALSVLLYEMLTGQVPFLGSSPAEILMKHMTAAADLSNIEEPFARAIRKGLAKDPAERHQSVQEMVEDIFGTEHIRNSVSQFAPEELSVVAEQAARNIQGVRPQGEKAEAEEARKTEKARIAEERRRTAEEVERKHKEAEAAQKRREEEQPSDDINTKPTIPLRQSYLKSPHPMRIAAVTTAFCVLAVAAALDTARYFDDKSTLAAQEQALKVYTQGIAQLADVAKTLETNETRRKEINADLAEVSNAVAHHALWSPVLVALSRSASGAITVHDLLAKREEQKVTWRYSIMMGVASPSGRAAVEQFIRDLRQQMPLAPGPDSIRIISQQQPIEGRTFQYYVIECHLEP